jgi:hypothetical protein
LYISKELCLVTYKYTHVQGALKVLISIFKMQFIKTYSFDLYTNPISKPSESSLYTLF